MKRFALIVLLSLIYTLGFSQTKGYLKYDSVYLQRDNGNSELVLLNATRDSIGFLFNKGNGRTEFKRILKKLSDNKYLVGTDTLVVNVDSLPTLQKVTTNGNITTNYIIHNAGSGNSVTVGNSSGNPFVNVFKVSGSLSTVLFGDKLTYNSGAVTHQLLPISYLTNRTWYLPDTTGTLPMTIKVNGIKYYANSNGLVDLGIVVGGSSVWGGIPGTLSDQADLQAALDLKLNVADTANKWITSTLRRADSVFYVKGGVEVFSHKDSTGAGSALNLQQVTDNGYFTTNPVSTDNTFLIRNNSNTSTLGLITNNGNAFGELFLTNSSFNISSRLRHDYLSFNNNGKTHYLKPPTSISYDVNLKLPNTAIDRVLPVTFKVNSTIYTANDSGLVDLGFASVNADSSSSKIRRGTFAQRPTTPDTGQVYYQTDRLVGQWSYDGDQWNFRGDPLKYYVNEQFNNSTIIVPRIGGLVGGAGSSAGTSESVGVGSYAVLNTGTTTTGYSSYGFVNSSGTTLVVDSMIQYHEYKVMIPVLSDGTESFTVAIGWLGHQNTWTFSTSCFIYHHANNSGRWETRTRKYDNSGNMTYKDCGVTVAANTWYKLGMEVNGYTKVINFYINDVLVTTHSTAGGDNIPMPNATVNNQYNFGIAKSAGTTTRQLYIDHAIQYIIKKKY